MATIDLIDLLYIFILVFLNGFFVASEFAFVKIRMTQIESMLATNSRGAKRAAEIVQDLDRSMSSTQLGITLSSIGLGFVGEGFFEAVFVRFFTNVENTLGLNIFVNETFITALSFLSGYLVITYLHVVLGELAPKSLSIQFATRVALICAEPLYWFMRITSPLLSFFVWSSNSILRIFGVQPAPEEHHESYSEDELKVIIKDSISKGEMEPYESKLIFNILDFTDENVKAILTPRIDIEALSNQTNVEEILELSISTGFSRIPIYEDKLDNIIGFIHIKDVVPFVKDVNSKKQNFDINGILRPVITIPEVKPLDDLLNEMQQLNTQVAVIVDEYGTIEGLVTIEDILEYIVGPIEDEFDTENISSNITVLDNKVIAGGLVSIETFNNEAEPKLGHEIISEGSATLAGYVLELFDSLIPNEGDKISDNNYEYTISKQNGNRIEEIVITVKK